jgi:hypothetical protein
VAVFGLVPDEAAEVQFTDVELGDDEELDLGLYEYAVDGVDAKAVVGFLPRTDEGHISATVSAYAADGELLAGSPLEVQQDPYD